MEAESQLGGKNEWQLLDQDPYMKRKNTNTDNNNTAKEWKVRPAEGRGKKRMKEPKGSDEVQQIGERGFKPKRVGTYGYGWLSFRILTSIQES